jgi:hypothetical protein
MYVNDGLMAQLIYAFVTSRLDYYQPIQSLHAYLRAPLHHYNAYRTLLRDFYSTEGKLTT